MSSIHPRRTPRPLLALAAVVLTGLALGAATNVAGATDAPDRTAAGKHNTERLVVRGEAKVGETPCAGGLCITLTDGQFRGTPVGTGPYTGAVTLRVADVFPNGEGGVCAPIDGHIVLGAGTSDRLILAVDGESCQDGAGNPATSSFTGLARFTVKHGTGIYAKAYGSGLATFAEDAADNDRMTLIGRIAVR